MTIPWLMNCGHSETGWCLNCVAAMGAELEALKARPEERPSMDEARVDRQRLEWLFSVLNDDEIARKLRAVSEVHAGGAMHGIHLRDWRHALDVARQQYVGRMNPRPLKVRCEWQPGFDCQDSCCIEDGKCNHPQTGPLASSPPQSERDS